MIKDLIAARGIEEVLHFTTNAGLLGILDTGFLKSRQRLNTDARLAHIFTANANVRTRDEAWLDFVNLSVSRINTWFAQCSEKWHRDSQISWCILSFSPEILTHDGVMFTTTNNIYTSVLRSGGVDGLNAMFAPKIIQYNAKIVLRNLIFPSNYTTCEQAEVLYPGQISTQFLNKVYVPSESIEDQVAGQLAAVGHASIKIEVCQSLFTDFYKDKNL